MAARVLVAYATKHGSTREIADRVGRTLGESGLEVDVREAGSVSEVSGYDAVVLGSALYAATWRRDANRFVTRHLAELQARPVWLFSSGPLYRLADMARIPVPPHVAVVTEPIGARDHRTFAGCLLPDTPGVDPQILASHPNGDFRDWPAIEAWARGIARAVHAHLARR